MGNINNVFDFKKILLVGISDEVEIESYENRQIIRINFISA